MDLSDECSCSNANMLLEAERHNIERSPRPFKPLAGQPDSPLEHAVTLYELLAGRRLTVEERQQATLAWREITNPTD
jgi:hypothetical protein